MRNVTAPAFLALTAVLTLSACSKSKSAPATAANTGPKSVVLADLDTSVNPCQDFYQYACGDWMKNNPIPADESRRDILNVLADHNQEVLHTILNRASGDPAAAADAPTREAGTYYKACMNETAINAAGAKPLAADLRAIDSIGNAQQFATELGRLQAQEVGAVFRFGSTPDLGNASAHEIAGADQGGLGLPNRGYYLRQDARSQALRKQYHDHVAQMFVLLGDTHATAAAEAAAVLRIETSLAQASISNVARRDPKANYHKMSLVQLEALTPRFDWKAFLAAADVPDFTEIDVGVPRFYRALNTDLRTLPLNDWKTYLRWHLVHTAAPSLSQPFVDANFAFFGTAMRGVTAQQPRWKRCVASTDQHLGDALGQLYVQVAFSPQAKAHMSQMVDNLEASLGQDIESLAWMTPATKKLALVKLHAIVKKVGYPDQWLDYSSIQLSPDNYYADVANTTAFQFHRQMSKIGKPADRSEWQMTPPTVNAYYTPLWNQIVFPAGILQPPFFSQTRDDAVNYGAVGAVMGHEMTHGFDDEGSQFDAHGNLHNWWTPADKKAFEERTACLVREYAGFSPLAGVHLNGAMTLGENIAENGGVRVAYMAMEKALGDQPDTKVDGFTREQRFFLGYAQVWCENERPQAARMAANVDPHAPGKFQVIGVVENMPEFAAAFHCGPTDPMTAGPNSCRVW